MSDENPVYQSIPAYDYVKQNILFLWFEIQREYKFYKRVSGTDRDYKTGAMSSSILALYTTMLRAKLVKSKKIEMVAEFDEYEKTSSIPKEKITEVINKLAEFLEIDLKLTDIGFEHMPYDQRFRNSYGIK